MEAWVKRQRQTSENWVVGGYYTTCPVRTHKTDDLISVWSGKDGGLGLKCWGSCTYSAIHEALVNAIKTGAPSVTEPPAAADDRIKELEEALAAAEDRASQSDRERAALENSNGELQDELETLSGENGDLANKLNTKVEEVEALQKEKSSLENSLSAAKDRRDQLKIERDSAKHKLSRREQKIADLQNDVQKLQDSLTGAKTEPELQELANKLNTKMEEVEAIQEEKSRLEDGLSDAKAERDQLKRERDSAKRKLSRREQKIADLQNDVRDLQEKLSRPEKTRMSSPRKQDWRKELSHLLVGNGRLSNSWRLFSKDEPTYAFVDATSILELDLRRALEQKIVLDDDGLQCMLMNASHTKLISEEQWRRLDGMRWQRNQVLHHRRQLKMPEARDALSYLGQVIDQLGS